MIEVNLYSVPSQDPNSMVGRCVARARFDKEAMGVSVMEFVKGFLRDNLGKFDHNIGNSELTGFINSDVTMSTKDLACVNYYLTEAGYKVQIQNVADDEDNANGVPTGEVVEWNIIDNNFIQYDYPTATKIMPADGMEIPTILRQVVSQSGLFDPNKFSGVTNPFTVLLGNLDKIKATSGNISPALTSQIYNLLGRMGFDIFCATSED